MPTIILGPIKGARPTRAWACLTPVIKIKTPKLDYLVFEKLNRQLNLRHAVTLRRPETTEQAIEKTVRVLGLDYHTLIKPRQIHSANVAVVRRPGETVSPVDGLCTTIKNTPLALVGADCPLILVYDPANQALGLAHAGWRGTAQKIALKLLRQMKTEFGSDPRQMLAGIGPAICQNCYVVGPEVAQHFQNQFDDTENYLFKIPGVKNDVSLNRQDVRIDHEKPKWRLDLSLANQNQLIREGLPINNIEISPYCTFEQEKWFYSYRREGEKTGRNALIAALI